MGYKNNIVLGALVGNIMEFYDFVIYGYLSVYLSKNFFPADSEIVSLLLTFGVFAGGYLTRPFGAIIFGHIGDTWGRKAALLYSIGLMTTVTFLLGTIPHYQQFGIISPCLITLFRLLQGLAVSGEQGGAIVYLAEYYKMKNLGILSAYMLCSVLGGVLLGSLTVVLCQSILSEADMFAWGWRLPFWLSCILGVVAMWLRTSGSESPSFENATKIHAQRPMVYLVKNNLSICFKMILLAMTFSVTMSFHNICLPILYANISNIGITHGMVISSIGIFCIAACSPMAGFLSEKIGYALTIRIGCILLLILGYPLFLLLQHGTIASTIIMEAIFAPISALISAPLFAVVYSGLNRTPIPVQVEHPFQ